MKHSVFLVLLGAFVGALASTASFWFIERTHPVYEYYATENAVNVSPHDIKTALDKGGSKYTVVDLRSAPEYQKAHIKGAVNIPGFAGDKTPEEQASRIIREFQKLPKDREIVVHCYTHYCTLASKVGEILAKQGIYVKHLNIGWGEWRYEWKSWNSEGDWSANPEDYVEGTDIKTDSGIPASGAPAPCHKDGFVGC